MWRIEGFEKVELEEELEGQFFAGDSYIIENKYMQGSKEVIMIYFWLGSLSTADEKGAAALLAKQADDAYGGCATQVRVVQGKEPLHFIRCFDGLMVVHSGGKASGFKNKQAEDTYDTDGTSLYHVRGVDEFDTRAVQVAEKASSLNSGDSFVLLTPTTMYVWKGTGANEAEHAVAMKLSNKLVGKRETKSIAEGEEPDAFWDALGGKAEARPPSCPARHFAPTPVWKRRCAPQTGSSGID